MNTHRVFSTPLEPLDYQVLADLKNQGLLINGGTLYDGKFMKLVYNFDTRIEAAVQCTRRDHFFHSIKTSRNYLWYILLWFCGLIIFLSQLSWK